MFEKLTVVALLLLFSLQNAFRFGGMVQRVNGKKMIERSQIRSQFEMVPNFKLGMAEESPYAFDLLDNLRMTEDSEDETEDDDGDEEEEVSTTELAPLISEDSAMSMIKEGIKFPTTLNGSDVRIGIIMARWNADVISGLYKVCINCLFLLFCVCDFHFNWF